MKVPLFQMIEVFQFEIFATMTAIDFVDILTKNNTIKIRRVLVFHLPEKNSTLL